MKIYDMIINDDEIHGVSTISLVESPAIEEEWVALSNTMKLQMADQDRKLLIGAALVPDRPIYRREGDEEFYIKFSRQTIEKVAHKFMMEMRLMSTNHEHSEELAHNTIVESWVTLGKNDKSYELGLNPPPGTWMIAMHVGSDKYWSEYVKSGKVKGFSIEGLFAEALTARRESVEDEFISELKALLR